MKILLINTLYYPNIIGGAEKIVQILAEGLVSDGHDVTVVCTSPKPGVSEESINGVKVYYVGLRNLYWPFAKTENSGFLKPFWHLLDTYNPFMMKELDRIIEKESPDLVNTHNLGGFSIAAWKSIRNHGLKIIHTIQDYYLLCPRSTMYRERENCESQCWNCKAFALPRKQASKYVDAVLGDSQYVIDRHVQAGYFKQAVIKTAAYSAVTTCPEPGSHSIDQSSGSLRVGFIGRLTEEKGIELLLDARKADKTSAWEVYVAGTGTEQYEVYLKQNYSQPNIHYLGYVRPDDFFSKIKVLVVPSLWNEPLGIVALEALSRGIPVIGSRRGGITEIIEEGKNGYTFDPNQPQSLAAILNRFVQNPGLACEMKNDVLSSARKYDLSCFLSRYIDAYGLLVRANESLNSYSEVTEQLVENPKTVSEQF